MSGECDQCGSYDHVETVCPHRLDGTKKQANETRSGSPEQSVVHTPGPWKVPKRFEIYQDLGPNVGGTYIGTTAGNRVLPESVAMVDEANARLMAAAPDLLKACEFTLDAIEAMRDGDGSCISPAVMYLRLAIEKATHKVV